MPVFRFFSLVFAVAAVLALPLAVLVATSGAVIDGVGAAMATVGPALAGAALYGLAPVRWRGIAASLLLAMVTLGWLVRSGYVFLYDFTGRGFGGEIFLHAGPTSLAIAIDEYGTGFGIVLAVLAAPWLPW